MAQSAHTWTYLSNLLTQRWKCHGNFNSYNHAFRGEHPFPPLRVTSSRYSTLLIIAISSETIICHPKCLRRRQRCGCKINLPQGWNILKVVKPEFHISGIWYKFQVVNGQKWINSFFFYLFTHTTSYSLVNITYHNMVTCQVQQCVIKWTPKINRCGCVDVSRILT